MRRAAHFAGLVSVIFWFSFGIMPGQAQQPQPPAAVGTAVGTWLEWYDPTEVIIWKIHNVGDEFEASITKSIRPSPGHLALDVIEPDVSGKFAIQHLKRNGLVYEGGELLSPNGRVADVKITLSPDGQTAVLDEANFGSIIEGVRKPDAHPHAQSSGLARID
jgi:hypothetical protein